MKHLDSFPPEYSTTDINQCTTFRPELVQVADKHYGVVYKNKTSSVDAASKDEALRFIETQKA